MIREAIVVEGRDDEAAVLRSVDALVICTHGFGIREETWQRIAAAYERQGIIVLTDPDHAGGEIRRRVTERFPRAKQAYLTRGQAEKKGDIGVENASPEDIRAALDAASAVQSDAPAVFTADDLFALGLAGGARSAELRAAVGARLGIGSANAGAFLKRLNAMNITKKELLAAWNDFATQKP